VLAVSHRAGGLASVADHGRTEDDLAGFHRSSSSSRHLRDGGGRSDGRSGSGTGGGSGSRAGAGDHGGSGIGSIDGENVLTGIEGRSHTKLEACCII
jgi:hypothetical protein